MRNIISRNVTGIIYQGQRALPGVIANLAAFGYSTEQGEAFTTRVSDLVDRRDAHAAAKVAHGTARTTHAAVVKTARGLVMTTRDVLKPVLGRVHSVAWAEAGFANNLAVAEDAAGLLQTVQGLKAYFTAHAGHENAALNITAIRFGTLAADMIARISALDTAKAALVTAAADRDAQAKLVREDLRLLLSKLRVSFDPFAAMWESVGFNRPGYVSVPAVPLNLVATLMSATSAALKWDAAERADRYRIYRKVVGVDADFVIVGTREALDFLLEGLPANALTQIAVAAVNSGGESAKSVVATVVTP